EDGIRDFHVTGVQTCALPISGRDTNCAAFSVMTALSGANEFTAIQCSNSSIAAPVVMRSSIDLVEPDSTRAPTCVTSYRTRSPRSEERRVGKEWRERGYDGG